MNPPSDPDAAPETRALLEYFYSISGLRTLSGQHSMYWDWVNHGRTLYVKQDEHVHNMVNKYPAVYGTDFGDHQNPAERQDTIELIKQQAADGRIITVSYHFPGERGNLSKVVDPANSSERPAFMDLIEDLVVLLRKLDVDGARVPVIFRPLHEMNAPWNDDPPIWWGRDGSNDLQKLWQEIWNLFHKREDKDENIHNVLWMFAPNAWLDSGSLVDPPDAYYPGHKFVDMLGADIYIEQGYQWRQEYHDGLRILGANRPIAITESGRLPDFPTLRITQPHWVYWLTWFNRYNTTAVGNDLPDNTPSRYRTVASDSAVVWRKPDIYVRDFVSDRGLILPSPDHIDDATGRHWWYESPDIKVDASAQSAVDLTNPANFESFVGEPPRRNSLNRVYVQVHNRGPGFAMNVKVKCLWTNATGGIPPLPADYWNRFPEFWLAPSPWKPIDPAKPYEAIVSLPPRSSRIQQFDWFVPPDAAEHTCMLAMVTVIDDPLAGKDTTHVRNEKRMALRNLHVIDTPKSPFKLDVNVAFFATRSIPRPAELAIDADQLPGGRIRVTIDQPAGQSLRLLQGRATSFRELSDDQTNEGWKTCEMDVSEVIQKPRPVEYLPRISGLALKPDHPTMIKIEWSSPDQLEPGSTYKLRILQLEDETVQGASTFVFRTPKPSPKYYGVHQP